MKYKEIPTDEQFVTRFLDKIEQIKDGDNCWVWKWSKTMLGYGTTSLQKTRFLSHRVSFFISNGSIDSQMVIDHICENRLCVNPKHLQETTIYTNLQNSIQRNPGRKNRTRLPKSLINGVCSNGHPVTSFDDLINYSKVGQNYRCVKCMRPTGIKRQKDYYKSTLKKIETGTCKRGHEIKDEKDINKQGKCKKCVTIYNKRWVNGKGKSYAHYYYHNVTKLARLRGKIE